MHPHKKEFLDLYAASGWSQAEVARKLEMTRQGINGIVTGEAVPSLTIVKLFRLLVQAERPGIQLPPPTHYLKEEKTPSSSTASRERSASWEEDVLQKLDGLSPEDRANIIGVMDAALKLVPRSGSRPRSEKRAA